MTVYVFDLDKTLTPLDAQTHHQAVVRVVERMSEEMGQPFDVTMSQMEDLKRHGKEPAVAFAVENGLDMTRCWNDIHEHVNYEELEGHPENAVKRLLLEALPGPKHVLTNANREHAEHTLKAMGIQDIFQTISDYQDIGPSGKFNMDYGNIVREKMGEVPEETVYHEDCPANLGPAHEAGARTVLINPKVHEAEYIDVHHPTLETYLLQECERTLTPDKWEELQQKISELSIQGPSLESELDRNGESMER